MNDSRGWLLSGLGCYVLNWIINFLTPLTKTTLLLSPSISIGLGCLRPSLVFWVVLAAV